MDDRTKEKMIENIITIIQSETIVSAIGTATVISIALSVFLYNGYYSKIWRACAVIVGFCLSFLILISGVGETNTELMCMGLIITFLCSSIGFVIGVFIYRREEVRSLKKNGVSCHLNSCEIQRKK